jgi:hypothetical protein
MGYVDASLLCGPSHVVDVFLKREFWCVHADDDQSVFFVPRGPGADVWQCAKPVMQGYVQKSTRTTLPWRSAAVSGSEFPGGRPTERGQVAGAGKSERFHRDQMQHRISRANPRRTKRERGDPKKTAAIVSWLREHTSRAECSSCRVWRAGCTQTQRRERRRTGEHRRRMDHGPATAVNNAVRT